MSLDRRPTEPFYHRRLSSPKSFRLMNLTPAKEFSAPIQCMIEEYFLNGNIPKYEALSYVWRPPENECQGGETEVEYVSVNGDREIEVTTNCAAALRRLRCKKKGRVLFVDSICIDQLPDEVEASKKERDLQIPLMGTIYRRARRTVIWLGEGDEAFWFLKWFSACLWLDPRNKVLGNALTRIVKAKEKLGDHRTGALVDLYSRSWFNRVWTLQELALSKESLLMCGSSSMSWDHFSYTGLQYLFKKIYGEFSSVASLEGFSNQMAMVNAVKLSAKMPQGGEAASSILTQARFRECFRREDKIYGMHQLLQHFGLKLAEPNYAKSVAEIYEESLVAIFVDCGWLFLLDFVSSPGRIDGLPSWVPDWSNQLQRGSDLKFPVCGKSKADVDLIKKRSPGELPLRGTFLSNIAECGEAMPLPNTIYYPERAMQIVKSLREWCTFASEHKAHLNSDWQKSLSSVMTMAQSMDAEARVTSHQLFLDWFNLLEQTDAICLSKNSEDPPDSTWNKNELFLMLLQTDERNRAGMSIMDFHDDVRGSHSGDQLFLTGDGYLGSGYHTLHAGDSIVLFAGATHPMIVRSKGHDKYTLIGPAYIHGIMEGEKWDDDESKLEVFTLA